MTLMMSPDPISQRSAQPPLIPAQPPLTPAQPGAITPTANALSRRVAVQGSMLFAGFGLAQLLSFGRNALIGHALSQSNFGIAATITLLLQVTETLSDFGSDRMIVQAPDGTTDRFFATSHCMLVLRGILIASVMFTAAPYAAAFFQVQHATQAFQLAAFGPIFKGFTHLDYRAAQRNLNNRPYLLIEVVPQAAALVMTPVMIALTTDYTLVVWLAIIQSTVSVMLAHAIAQRPYTIGFDREIFMRQFAFGWPILLGALPIIAVFQGDRIIIGRMFGMEQLAVYSAAFMIAMVPGLVIGKVSHALLLPLFADCLRHGQGIKQRFQSVTEATVVFAALYLAAFCIAGAWALPIVFGDQYAGHGAVVGWLAAMWAVRMIQAVPGAGLMAYGTTKPFLIAGLLRAHALPCVLWAAAVGCSLETLAAIGVVFEIISLGYIIAQLSSLEPQLGPIFFNRALFLLPAGAGAYALHLAFGPSALGAAMAGFVASGFIFAFAIIIMPTLRHDLRRAVRQPPAIKAVV